MSFPLSAKALYELLYRSPALAYKRIALTVAAPIILAGYFEENTGKDYGIDLKTKASLLSKMIRNTRRIPTYSHPFEHLLIASKLMKVPPSIGGCVVECGCYAGGSTANLSLVCALTGRRLEVFDSFEGLPTPSDEDHVHTVLDLPGVESIFSQGEYRSGIEEVKENVSKWGDIGVCGFNAGWFEDTLPSFAQDSVLVFTDVDLRASLETCLEHLWPLLREGCYFFTHEADELEIASLFFDREWWREKLGQDPPGLAGAGSGLGLVPHRGGFDSCLGFSVKGSPG